MKIKVFDEINNFETYRTPTEVHDFVVFCTEEDGTIRKK